MNPFKQSYRADRRGDVMNLVSDMKTLSREDMLRAVIIVHKQGLMLATGALRFLLWLGGLRNSMGKEMIFRRLYNKDPEAVQSLWDQTCMHVLTGRDQEDFYSVGGWSQREIDLFLENYRKTF